MNYLCSNGVPGKTLRSPEQGNGWRKADLWPFGSISEASVTQTQGFKAKQTWNFTEHWPHPKVFQELVVSLKEHHIYLHSSDCARHSCTFAVTDLFKTADKETREYRQKYSVCLLTASHQTKNGETWTYLSSSSFRKAKLW